MKYINPLRLYDHKGVPMLTNNVPELHKHSGYIFDSFFLTIIEAGFSLQRFDQDHVCEELRQQAYFGVKNNDKVVSLILPLTTDLINVEFEYEFEGEDDFKETLLFKRGQLQRTLVLPERLKPIFKDVDPEDYDVYTAISRKTKKNFVLILKEKKDD